MQTVLILVDNQIPNDVISDYMESDSIQKSSGRSLPLHEAQAGPVLAGLLSVALIGLWVVVYWQGEGSLDAVRVIGRLMIRIAVVLFSLSFTASALVSLFPNRATNWILKNRRNFTSTFVIAFALHLCAIARFYALDPSLFMSVSPPLTIALRVVGVFFIVLMLLAPDQGGVRRWNILNTAGGYYIWAGLLNGFTKRVALDRFYYFPVALLILALAVKAASRVRFHKTDGSPVVE